MLQCRELGLHSSSLQWKGALNGGHLAPDWIQATTPSPEKKGKMLSLSAWDHFAEVGSPTRAPGGVESGAVGLGLVRVEK